VLRLTGGIAGDHGEVGDRLAADPGGVVLDPAVLAVRTDVVEPLVLIQRADRHQHGPHYLGALHEAVHRRALQGDVVGQVVQPHRVVIGELAGGIVALGRCHAAPPSGSGSELDALCGLPHGYAPDGLAEPVIFPGHFSGQVLVCDAAGLDAGSGSDGLADLPYNAVTSTSAADAAHLGSYQAQEEIRD